jgi:hypothetical protein
VLGRTALAAGDGIADNLSVPQDRALRHLPGEPVKCVEARPTLGKGLHFEWMPKPTKGSRT